ncbi:DUF4393 domain-containing protein [Micromonospora sp. NPDC049301]|uniref:DUF4393 domain-containing protein n=1 Tax=Micromonospora sp. NPDC049301 TaxID=3155723 RepID=UPI003446EDD5
MTGPEIAAVGKAVEVIGQKALGQDEKTRDELLQAAQDTPEFKAAARTAAARMAVKERIKLKLYQPFARMIGVSQEYFADVFPEEMAAKTASIPDEHMVTPPASIAVPAMHGLSYSFDDPDLKEMYLNLLTAAADDRRSEDAHPAFVEVIKQLSARETNLLNTVLLARETPLVRLDDRLETGGYDILLMHVMNLRDLNGEPIEDPAVPAWVDNWGRLGLVRVGYEVSLHGGNLYDWARKRPEYIRFSEGTMVRITKGYIARTAFGERFLRAVSPPPATAATVATISVSPQVAGD